MKTRAIQFITITLTSFAILAAGAATPPTATELLDKYTQALDATQSFIESYEEVSDYSYRLPGMVAPTNGKRFGRGQLRADGRRIYLQDYTWGDFNDRLRNLPPSNPRYSLRIEAAGKLYVDSTAINDPQARGSVYSQPAHRDKAVISIATYSGIHGFLGSEERLDAVLRGANRISVRARTEAVNGSACHVIDADTKHGQYSVWLDPGHGYHAAKVTREAAGGQKENEAVMPKGDRSTGRVEITRFEQVGGVWVPMEADHETDYSSGEFFRRDHSHFKRTKITLNPDHDKLRSFDDPLLQNPTNDPELRNGTRVRITGPIQVRGSWQDGKVVNAEGKVLFDSRLKNTSADKPTPAGKK